MAGFPPTDFDGRRLPFVPEPKFVVSPSVSLPLGDVWKGTRRVDVVHQLRRYVRADNLFDDKVLLAPVRFFDSVNVPVVSPLVQGPERRQIGGSVRYSF